MKKGLAKLEFGIVALTGIGCAFAAIYFIPDTYDSLKAIASGKSSDWWGFTQDLALPLGSLGVASMCYTALKPNKPKVS